MVAIQHNTLYKQQFKKNWVKNVQIVLVSIISRNIYNISLKLIFEQTDLMQQRTKFTYKVTVQKKLSEQMRLQKNLQNKQYKH